MFRYHIFISISKAPLGYLFESMTDHAFQIQFLAEVVQNTNKHPDQCLQNTIKELSFLNPLG